MTSDTRTVDTSDRLLYARRSELLIFEVLRNSSKALFSMKK